MRYTKRRKDGTQVLYGDLWPARDQVCHGVAYRLEGAEQAIKFCKAHDLVFQAGGCVGVWPRYLRNHFSKVHTFEPSIDNFELMQTNIAGIPDIEMHYACLSDKPGRKGIKENPKNCGDDQTREGDEIDAVTIDSFHVEPDLIYLDIQGDEPLALLGAVQTIERCSPVIAIEVDNKLAKVHGDAVGFLLTLGYKCVAKVSQDWIFTR